MTVESSQGYDLNISLFERLANANPISTLGIQHRMHPDISSIPKLLTYNDLEDAMATVNHPQVLGIESRVVFIDHNSQEDNQSVDALESVSKTNSYEREMVVQIVKYILKQGYAPQDIVVLTPYLGQMLKIQSDIATDLAVFLDERDIRDARDQLKGDDNFATELSSTKSGQNSMGIRVATIDNYQGEESKIVVVSLVRSNGMGQIGFLREPERVNVMLSRARDCEIIIGSRATLEAAKGSAEPLRGGPLWKKIFNHLTERQQVFNGLPAVCQNHGSRNVLSSPKDFETYCRDGGCKEPCNKILGCGHPCPSRCHPGKCMSYLCVELCKKELVCGHPCNGRCHPGDCPKCRVICPDVCSRGHPLTRACGDDHLPKCHRRITWMCPLNHVASGPCYAGKFGSDCDVCVNLRKEEEEYLKRELELNAALIEKRTQLSSLMRDLEEKKQAKVNNEELAALEAERVLVEEELSRFLSEEVLEEQSHESKSISYETGSTIAHNVVTLLKKRDCQSVSLQDFPNIYNKEFGTKFNDDAIADAHSSQNSKRRKLKDILEELPVCDVVVPTQTLSSKKKKRGKNKCPEYVVKLRKDIDGFSLGLPSPKHQKVEPSESAEDMNNLLSHCKVSKDFVCARKHVTLSLHLLELSTTTT